MADDLVEVDVNNVVADVPAAVVQAANPGMTITPSANFSITLNGVILSYIAGQTQVVTSDELAAMTAAGAPFSQP